MSAQQSELYKYTAQIDYLADLVGADVARDIVKVVVEQVDDEVNISDRANRDLGKVDVAQADSNLPTILETDNVGVAKENTLSSTLSREVANWTAGTLPVEQQSAISVEDTEGNGVDPAAATDFPNSQTVGHDLIGTGDLTVGPVSVARSEALVISANSQEGNTFSASIEWVDNSSNLFQSESATDIGMSGITQDWSRLVRKGPYVTVTFTDTSGATANNVNVHIDTEK